MHHSIISLPKPSVNDKPSASHKPSRFKRLVALGLFALVSFSVSFHAMSGTPGAKAPDRKPDEGQGPWETVILRGANIVTGEGAPAQGPVDIVIKQDRIVEVVSVGHPQVPIKTKGRPVADENTHEIDVTGHYILPGFVDMHGHIGASADNIPAEYVFKLWLAHGITTVREPGSFAGIDWTLDHVKRAEKNQIASPRIIPYLGFGMGQNDSIFTAKQAREWMRFAKRMGFKGVKMFGAPPKIMQAALDEAKKQNLGTAMHHAQLNVVKTNVLDSARQGLTTMEHWYGLPEALFENQRIQNYSPEYNYNNEQDRFAEAGLLWLQAAQPNSAKWNAVRDELIALDFTINPTMTIYEASRDLMRERNADWHQDYTLPTLWNFFTPSRYAHGSYWFDWTTDNEIQWKHNFQRWMTFLNDYKNHGGRITTGSDSGYIYKIYGFGYIRELELLREAGFNALEVIQAATLNGAEALDMEDDIGSLIPGKKADLVIVEENPLRNFKVLYGTGHYRLNDNNQPVRTDGVKYTMRDGILYDAKALLKDVREMVAEAKVEAAKMKTEKEDSK